MIVGDALIADVLRDAVADSQPEVVVHLLTALPPGGALRPRQLRLTNALRVTATANLLRAAVPARSRRLVAESFIGVYGSAALGHSTSEDEPSPSIPDGPLRESVTALRSLEDQLHTVRDGGSIDTVALRLGFLYGPGVPSTTQLITRHGVAACLCREIDRARARSCTSSMRLQPSWPPSNGRHWRRSTTLSTTSHSR
jgi:nucleoside-diphosphate-sugar epimerase